jgi:hypothetical protein
MRKVVIIAASVSSLAVACPSYAADHLFTATAAGGLTTSSQPFLNGINNNAPTADTVPGQGSPLSGAEHTVPASDTRSGATLTMPPPVLAGKTAPSANASVP